MIFVIGGNIVIALEDDKKEAFLEFKKIIKNYPHISVKLLKKIYPLGEERILIKEILREIINVLKKKLKVWLEILHQIR